MDFLLFASPFLIMILVLFLLYFLIVIPLPIYLGGKIAKIQHEKFTYLSCIWTGLATGIVMAVIGGLFKLILSLIFGTVPFYVIFILSILAGILVFGFFFKKSYSATNLQVLIVYIGIVVFTAIISIILPFLFAKLNLTLFRWIY